MLNGMGGAACGAVPVVGFGYQVPGTALICRPARSLRTMTRCEAASLDRCHLRARSDCSHPLRGAPHDEGSDELREVAVRSAVSSLAGFLRSVPFARMGI